MSDPVVVLGLGAMGSAIAAHLARRGERVLGLEQFHPAHDRGSSHGRSRIIRLAYFEHPDYVPLLRRSFELWRELEAETKRELLLMTGGLMIGPPGSAVVEGALASARQHGLAHELLDAGALRRRWPVFQVRDDDIASFEHDAGVLYPEDCVRAHQDLAIARGAELRFGARARILSDPRAGGPIELEVGQARVRARKLVVSAGSWVKHVLPQLGFDVVPERVVQLWFDPVRDAASFAPARFPIFIWDTRTEFFYGFPELRGDGVKVAFHHAGTTCDPETVDRTVAPSEVERVRVRIRRSIPALDGKLRGAATCIYTNTKDEHFAVGALGPDCVLASPCSGHGFKFAAVIGEIVADLVTKGSTRHPIGLFGLERAGLR